MQTTQSIMRLSWIAAAAMASVNLTAKTAQAQAEPAPLPQPAPEPQPDTPPLPAPAPAEGEPATPTPTAPSAEQPPPLPSAEPAASAQADPPPAAAPPPPLAAPAVPVPVPVPVPMPVPVLPPDDNSDPAWTDSIDYRVFADAYFSHNWGFPKPQAGVNGGPADVRAYDTTNGFALSWVGADLSIPAEPIGGTLALRWGQTANAYADSCLGVATQCDSEIGLTAVKQAYASWAPAPAVTLDFGKFDTIYGAEVAESQDNLNYTRGALYWLGQPLFHTGLRASGDIDANLGWAAMVVNGWNNTVDNNSGKSLGLQLTGHAPDSTNPDGGSFSAALGYMIGPEHDDLFLLHCPDGEAFVEGIGCGPSQGAEAAVYPVDRADSDTKGLRHFVDLVLRATPAPRLDLVLNADLGIDNDREHEFSSTFESSLWWGAMLASRYGLDETFGVAARGEYYADPDGMLLGEDVTILTGTFTVDAQISRNLLVRLDNRFDWSDKKIFQSSVRDHEGTQFTSAVGVVVSTD